MLPKYHEPDTFVKHTFLSSHWYSALNLVAVSFLLLLTACQTQPQVDVDHAYRVYETGDYQSAYNLARQARRQGPVQSRSEADYVAGLSAFQLGKLTTAAKHLTKAASTHDTQLAADAMASLGMVYGQMGRHADAANVLLQAATNLQGQDAANAYFYAATMQRKIGQQSQAQTNLILARSLSTDHALRQQIEQMMHVTGYTIQTGAFTKQANIQKALSRLRVRAASIHIAPPRVIQTVNANGQKLSLVQVGQFSNYGGALAARQRLGIPGALIVPLSKPN